MDPYLEAHWRDIHAGLVVYASDALQEVLPRAFRARIEERVLLESPQGLADHPRFPDVRVVEYTSRRGLAVQPEAGAAVAEPLLVDTETEPLSETYLEIIDRSSGNRVITVIEFLSPSNKTPGPNREQYRRKQRKLCASDVNLMEIDLNRFGVHTLAFPLQHLKPQARTSYLTCVRRTTRPGQAEVYLMPLWQRLPTVKVPLRPEDADVTLDVQALVDKCYRNGGYEGTHNYATDPDPPLLGAEEGWAQERLQAMGLQPRKKPPRCKGKPKSP
jgi:hypothetical protein